MRKLFVLLLAFWLILPGGEALSDTAIVGGGGTTLPSSCSNGQVAVYNATTGLWDTCSANAAAGSGTLNATGTPANHYWPVWTNTTTLKAVNLTGGFVSKPICTDSSGDPAVCAGTEGVWQAALTYPVTGVAAPTAGLLVKWGPSGNTLVDGLKFGTMTDNKYCSYSTASGLVCNSTGGTVAISGTPSNHQWAGWTDASTVKGFSVTGSKVVCSDSNGDPVACTNLTDAAIPTASSLQVSNLITLSGVAAGANDLGTFTGSTIADSQTIKVALQTLETAFEALPGGHTQNTDTGTTGQTFQIQSGSSGVKVKNNSGALEARNAADGAYANIRGDTITAAAFSGPLTGNVTGNVSGTAGSATGSAASLAGQYIDWNSSSGGASIANKPTLGTMAAETATNYVLKSLYDANTILYATTDNTPAALTVNQQTLVGRDTGGAIAAIGMGTGLSISSGNLTVGTLNQNTSGTAANLSGTPALPNGVTATTQTAGDNSTKLATTAYVNSLIGAGTDGNYGASLNNNTSTFAPSGAYTYGLSFIGGFPNAYFGSANHKLVTGPATPTAGYTAKWNTSGDDLVDAFKVGTTFTDAKWCSYTTSGGLICNENAPGGAFVGGTLTAALTLRAGAIGAGNGPLYFQAGSNLTTPASGAVEFDGTDYYLTNTVTRYSIPLSLAAAPLRFTTGGTTARTITLPDAAITVARTDAAQTFTGVQTMTAPVISGHATIEGVTPTGATGTGKMVFDGTPTLVTPVIGTATGTSLAVTGTLDGKATVYASGATQTVTALSSYVVCTQNCTITLPTPAAGVQVCARNSNNGNYTIAFAALGGSIYYERPDHTGLGTAGTGTLSASAGITNSICLVGYDSTHYYVWGTPVGTWTAN